MPRFSLGDAGEARWPLSHRWTDTSPILPDAEHDSRNQGRMVSHCVEPPLRARPTQPAAGSSPQLAASAESLLPDAERSNKRFTCLLHLSDVTLVRHLRVPSQYSARSLPLLLLCKQRCSSCLGHYRHLETTSASDKCPVRCRPIKQRDKICRNF